MYLFLSSCLLLTLRRLRYSVKVRETNWRRSKTNGTSPFEGCRRLGIFTSCISRELTPYPPKNNIFVVVLWLDFGFSPCLCVDIIACQGGEMEWRGSKTNVPSSSGGRRLLERFTRWMLKLERARAGRRLTTCCTSKEPSLYYFPFVSVLLCGCPNREPSMCCAGRTDNAAAEGHVRRWRIVRRGFIS